MEFLYHNYDPQKASERLEQRILNAETVTMIVDEILKLAEEQKGKQLTKRFATKLQENLPAFRVSYYKEFGMYYLYFYGEGLTDNKAQMLIGYADKPEDQTIDPEIIKERLKAYWLDRERLIKYLEARKHIKQFCEEMQKAQKLADATMESAREYGVEYMLKAGN